VDGLSNEEEARLDAGTAAYERRDWDAAFALFSPLADDGVPKASSGFRDSTGSASAAGEVAARLTPEQRREAESLIAALRVRFVGDGEKWTWSPGQAAT
jgi:hypothetical protein